LNYFGLEAPLINWIGIVTASFIFGLLHLPAASQVFKKTPILTTRVLVLNMVAGISFGWLFWHYGLISAGIAHFTADVVLHVIAGPTLNKRLFEKKL